MERALGVVHFHALQFSLATQGVISCDIRTHVACGEVPLAEHVLQAARQQGCATLVVYSALIRVYAVARLFHKTCDLYKTLLDEGLEPDTVMSRMRAWPV